MLEASWWRKPDFPQKTLSECLGILQNGAKATAWNVATQIATSSHRGVLGGEFAAISWSLMGIWRQIYYLRRLEEGHYDEFPDFAGLEVQARSFLNSTEYGTSEAVRKEMVNQSKALLGTAKDIRKAWEEWRFEKVKVKAWTEIYDDPNKKQGFIQLTDQLTDTHQIFQTEKKQILNEPPWPEELEQQKWQDVVFENYKKMLYIKEFIPTMQTMPYLKQLIPGQEKDRPEPAPFDEFIQLRFSAFLAGAGKPHMNKAALREGKWMLAPDKIPDNGPIEKMSALQDDVIRQLTFINTAGHKVVLGTRMADPQPEKHLPKKTCGLDLGYRDDWMVRITFLNAEEEAEVAELKTKNRDETAIFSTGVGLCGLYTFDRPTHEAKDFGGTGDAFEVQFRWDPDESGNHKWQRKWDAIDIILHRGWAELFIEEPSMYITFGVTAQDRPDCLAKPRRFPLSSWVFWCIVLVLSIRNSWDEGMMWNKEVSDYN